MKEGGSMQPDERNALLRAESRGGDSDLVRVLDDEGRAEWGKRAPIDRTIVVGMYEAMVRTRIVDDRLFKLQRQGRIGFHVGSLGEEASIIASAAALRPEDWIVPCYREWGALLYRGWPLQAYVDHMLGNADDVARGRQMPAHVVSRDLHYLDG
jgi:2-oxoisovalerate dehydrogenase E1 component alpha subunit